VSFKKGKEGEWRLMDRVYRAKITSKGQVTIPIEIRREMGLNPGDLLEIRESHRG
jgi:AbrB family looped-hinge helix DNA binding protein